MVYVSLALSLQGSPERLDTLNHNELWCSLVQFDGRLHHLQFHAQEIQRQNEAQPFYKAIKLQEGVIAALFAIVNANLFTLLEKGQLELKPGDVHAVIQNTYTCTNKSHAYVH